MQNGTIAHFTKIRIAILEEIKDTTASMIEVTSTHRYEVHIYMLLIAFAYFLS